MIAAILAGLILASNPITLAQQQRVVGALYQITTTARVVGSFPGLDKLKNERKFVTDENISLGSGTMVSPDGYLLTARHVIDEQEKVEELCELLEKRWPGNFQVAEIQLAVVIKDIIGLRYGYRRIVDPLTAGQNVCAAGAVLRGSPDNPNYSEARLVEQDALADVALLKLAIDTEAEFLPLAYVAPAVGSSVFILGYFGDGERASFLGSVDSTCTEQSSSQAPGGCGLMLSPPRLYQAMCINGIALSGMSGGPVMQDGKMIGLTIMRSLLEVKSYAIPAVYLSLWLEWVRNPGLYRRPSSGCPIEGKK